MSITPMLDKITSEFKSKYLYGTQVRAHIDEALDNLGSALTRLATYGHFFDLTDTPAPEPVEWPKAAYHAGGEYRVVNSQEEFDELGPDWSFEHPDAPGAKPAVAPNPAPGDDTVLAPEHTPPVGGT